jgi:hypothetical protein
MAMKVTGTVTITDTTSGEVVEDLLIDITDATGDEIQRLLDSAVRRTVEVTISRYRTPRGWQYEWNCEEGECTEDGFDTIAAAERDAAREFGVAQTNIIFTNDWE